MTKCHLIRFRRRALSQIEVIIATIFVSLVVVSALHSFGVVLHSREKTSIGAQAEMLAHALMTEILATDYEDEVLPMFGPEVDELLSASRATFDDVDDYHGWSSKPPKSKDGTKLTQYNGLTRSVTVALVRRSDPTLTSLLDEGVKRIQVTVRHGTSSGTLLATCVALRTKEYTNP